MPHQLPPNHGPNATKQMASWAAEAARQIAGTADQTPQAPWRAQARSWSPEQWWSVRCHVPDLISTSDITAHHAHALMKAQRIHELVDWAVHEEPTKTSVAHRSPQDRIGLLICEIIRGSDPATSALPLVDHVLRHPAAGRIIPTNSGVMSPALIVLGWLRSGRGSAQMQHVPPDALSALVFDVLWPYVHHADRPAQLLRHVESCAFSTLPTDDLARAANHALWAAMDPNHDQGHEILLLNLVAMAPVGFVSDVPDQVFACYSETMLCLYAARNADPNMFALVWSRSLALGATTELSLWNDLCPTDDKPARSNLASLMFPLTPDDIKSTVVRDRPSLYTLPCVSAWLLQQAVGDNPHPPQPSRANKM